MTLVEISEREVIKKAREWARKHEAKAFAGHATDSEVELLKAVFLLEERERVEQSLDTGTVPQPRIETLASPHQIETYQKLITEPAQSERYATVREASLAAARAEYPELGPDFVPDMSILSPSPRPGAEPVLRRPKKLSRKEQMAEARRASDVTGRDRVDIDYSSDDLPSAR